MRFIWSLLDTGWHWNSGWGHPNLHSPSSLVWTKGESVIRSDSFVFAQFFNLEWIIVSLRSWCQFLRFCFGIIFSIWDGFDTHHGTAYSKTCVVKLRSCNIHQNLCGQHVDSSLLWVLVRNVFCAAAALLVACFLPLLLLDHSKTTFGKPQQDNNQCGLVKLFTRWSARNFWNGSLFLLWHSENQC